MTETDSIHIIVFIISLYHDCSKMIVTIAGKMDAKMITIMTFKTTSIIYPRKDMDTFCLTKIKRTKIRIK